MDIIYSIYMATNKLNGKIYIGFTQKSLEVRKSQHIKLSKNKSVNYKLHNALRKYGTDCFDWMLLYQSKDYHHTKNVMEQHFIELFDSVNSGYNMSYGGEGIDSEYRKTLWNDQNSKYNTEHYRQIRSIQMKKMRSEKDSLWNTEESKRKRIESGIKAKGKKYIVTDPFGNRYEVFGLSEFCRKHNLSPPGMFTVAAGKYNSHKGWSCVKCD